MRTRAGEVLLARLVVALAAAGVLLVAAAGLLVSPGGPPGTAEPPEESGPARTVPVPAGPVMPVLEAPSGGAPSRPTLPSGPPQRVSVPSLGIEAAVVPVAAEHRELTPPGDPRLLGWWAGGAWAGARRGSALVTGHTVHTGGGALDHLERVRPGARVEVRTPRGRIDYVVLDVVVLGKQELARRAADLFSQEVEGRLVLVTCEDWDGAGYRSNVVVTARPRVASAVAEVEDADVAALAVQSDGDADPAGAPLEHHGLVRR